MKIGEKIRELRRERKISQEELARGLGVSFQAVSKWENGVTAPDIALLPPLASMLCVSIDELFSYDAFKVGERIAEICAEAAECRDEEPERAERMLREALLRHPGNEVLLNNLLYTIRSPERDAEVVEIAEKLARSARYDDVRYDALRILAETYSRQGEYSLAEERAEAIPEIYFTKLEVAANTLRGEKRVRAAEKQARISAATLREMYAILVEEGLKDEKSLDELTKALSRL